MTGNEESYIDCFLVLPFQILLDFISYLSKTNDLLLLKLSQYIYAYIYIFKKRICKRSKRDILLLLIPLKPITH